MSADLELPLIIKINHPQISDHNSSSENCETTTAQSGGGVVAEEECRTPRSPRNTIPAMLSCPPPPKKLRRVVEDSCRRKLRDFRFFETVAGEEIESFFRTVEVSYTIVHGGSTKRKLCFM